MIRAMTWSQVLLIALTAVPAALVVIAGVWVMRNAVRVLDETERPCLFGVMGPCQHPKCLEAHYETIRLARLRRREEYERGER